jgi:hypothetical protein
MDNIASLSCLLIFFGMIGWRWGRCCCRVGAPVDLFVNAAPSWRCLLLFVVFGHCRVAPVWLTTAMSLKMLNTRELVQQIARNVKSKG